MSQSAVQGVDEQQVNADARKELLLLELWSRRFEPVTETQPSPIDISIARFDRCQCRRYHCDGRIRLRTSWSP